MIKNIVFIILFLYQATASAAEPIKVVTTITPLASITAMILGDDGVAISAINNVAGCPHHHALKFSEREQINNADYFIYIDRYFDNPIANAPREFTGHKIEISKFQSINFSANNNEINWHFWLNLDNAIALCKELSFIFQQNMPNLKIKIIKNTNQTIKKLHDLKKYKDESLQHLAPLLITSDSLEHFFTGIDTDITHIYKKSMQSLGQYHQLEHFLATKQKHVVVADIHQNVKLYKKFKLDIVQLDSENWHIDLKKDKYSELFIKKYLSMINQLKDFKQE